MDNTQVAGRRSSVRRWAGIVGVTATMIGYGVLQPTATHAADLVMTADRRTAANGEIFVITGSGCVDGEVAVAFGQGHLAALAQVVPAHHGTWSQEFTMGDQPITVTATCLGYLGGQEYPELVVTPAPVVAGSSRVLVPTTTSISVVGSVAVPSPPAVKGKTRASGEIKRLSNTGTDAGYVAVVGFAALALGGGLLAVGRRLRTTKAH